MTRRPNILLVEDEAMVRAVVSEFLRDEGFCVIEAAAADEAIALLERHPEIDVLFTDVNMPGSLDGLGLAAQARERRPHLPVVMTSGQWSRTDAPVPDGTVFLRKPYSVCAAVELMRALVKVA